MRFWAMLEFAAVLVLTAWTFCNVLDAGLPLIWRWFGGVVGIGGFFLLCWIWERVRGPPGKIQLGAGKV